MMTRTQRFFFPPEQLMVVMTLDLTLNHISFSPDDMQIGGKREHQNPQRRTEIMFDGNLIAPRKRSDSDPQLPDCALPRLPFRMNWHASYTLILTIVISPETSFLFAVTI